jgi:3-isopropylmalate/(R)-2-methylmalate dehydratase small subunit
MLEARAIVVRQDDIDTDVLYPGAYLNVTDVAQMPQHLFEGLDPSLRDELRGSTALVVGSNFGSGSSREHVPQAMRTGGVRFLVGKSFARIFYRNCVDLGLAAVVCPDAVEAAHPGSTVRLELAQGTVEVDGRTFRFRPMPAFMQEIVDAGGLVEWMTLRGTSS